MDPRGELDGNFWRILGLIRISWWGLGSGADFSWVEQFSLLPSKSFLGGAALVGDHFLDSDRPSGFFSRFLIVILKL